MTPKYRGSRIEVRPDIIKQNALTLMRLVGEGFFCPMIKANAYGHGVQLVANLLNDLGVKSFGVATWDEAVELRDLGFHQDILVFSRIRNAAEARVAVAENLTPVISQKEDLLRFAKESSARKTSAGKIHIKFDTGIHRMGFSLEEADEVLELIKSQKNLKLDGVLTHMSHAEDGAVSEGHTDIQIQRFIKVAALFADFSPQLHALNSSGFLERSKTFKDAQKLGCRPGIGLYGGVRDARLSSLPAMRIVSSLDHIRTIKVNEGVSYGWRWIAPKDSLVGVVPIGYGDGYLRSLGNKSFVLVKGRRAPVVGSVCMDYILVNLTELASQDVKTGDEVVILGEQGNEMISPMDLADWAQTIPFEIMTNMGLRRNRMEIS